MNTTPILLSQAYRISNPTTNAKAHGTAVKLSDGSHLTIAHNLVHLLNWKNNTKQSFMSSMQPYIKNGSIELVSKVFEYTPNNFDAVLRLKPQFFKNYPQIKLTNPSNSPPFAQPKQMNPLTKAHFLQMNLVGADKQGRVIDTTQNLATYGQSGAQLVSPEDNVPYFTLIGGKDTLSSRWGAVTLSTLFDLPIGRLIGNPNANFAIYVPNSADANYMVLHDRSSGQLFQVFADGTQVEIK